MQPSRELILRLATHCSTCNSMRWYESVYFQIGQLLGHPLASIGDSVRLADG